MSAWWQDLSDEELVGRLVNRRVPLVAAIALKDAREEPDAIDQINELLA